jgi:ParB family chromosome partitioning protein
MPRKAGLPDLGKSKHSSHLVDEISKKSKTSIIRSIPLEKIEPNTLQPRKDYGNLNELSLSIKEKGILEPVLIRPKNGKFEIIAGERRFKAAKLAGLTELPCIQFDIADNEALEYSIIENIQRKDLNIYEYAYSLKSLAELYGYTHQDIAQKIGKSRVTVSELIRVTDLPQDIIQKCNNMNITSKTFLLELVKLEDKNKMLEVLKDYSEEPFSRDHIKKKRKDEEEEDNNDKAAKSTNTNKPFKFNFSSDDKEIKINFKINSKEVDKSKIINILEQLIKDIKSNKIKEFDLKP